MTDFRYVQLPQEGRPSVGLPAEFAFQPSVPMDGDIVQCEDSRIVGIMQALQWCDEQFGEGTNIGLADPNANGLDPDHAWGYWPQGTIFIRDPNHAVWFKVRWS